MFAFSVLVILLVGTVLIVRSEHAQAVQKSEANLRAKFNSGQYNAQARILMQQAGYKV